MTSQHVRITQFGGANTGGMKSNKRGGHEHQRGWTGAIYSSSMWRLLNLPMAV